MQSTWLSPLAVGAKGARKWSGAKFWFNQMWYFRSFTTPQLQVSCFVLFYFLKTKPDRKKESQTSPVPPSPNVLILLTIKWVFPTNVLLGVPVSFLSEQSHLLVLCMVVTAYLCAGVSIHELQPPVSFCPQVPQQALLVKSTSPNRPGVWLSGIYWKLIMSCLLIPQSEPAHFWYTLMGKFWPKRTQLFWLCPVPWYQTFICGTHLKPLVH